MLTRRQAASLKRKPEAAKDARKVKLAKVTVDADAASTASSAAAGVAAAAVAARSQADGAAAAGPAPQQPAPEQQQPAPAVSVESKVEAKAAGGVDAEAQARKELASEDDLREIFPDVLLGGEFGARKVDLLKRLGVTGVVNCTNEWGQFSVENFARDKFEYHRVPVHDNVLVHIDAYFDKALEFVKRHHAKGGKVLIHCWAGKSRSVTCLLAFCVRVKKMTLRDAFLHVQKQRMEIQPNVGFRRRLLGFEMQELGSNSFRSASDWPLRNSRGVLVKDV